METGRLKGPVTPTVRAKARIPAAACCQRQQRAIAANSTPGESDEDLQRASATSKGGSTS